MKKELLCTIANNIKKLREMNNMTQEGLSYKAGVTVRHIQRIEKGNLNSTILTLHKISSAFNIPLVDLLKK